MARFDLGLLLALAVGCGGGEETDTDGALSADDGAADECGATPPEIEALVISDAGMSVGDECGSEIRPMIRIQANGSDADGDLHYWTLRVWWDETVDNQVSGEYQEVFSTVGEECSVHTAQVAMLLCVTGDPPFETLLEIGAVLMDDQDNESGAGTPTFGTFTTPDSQGSYGN